MDNGWIDHSWKMADAHAAYTEKQPVITRYIKRLRMPYPVAQRFFWVISNAGLKMKARS